MGEYDTIAELAAQVADLRTTVSTWTARLDRETGSGLMVRLDIKRLREQVERLAADLAAALDTGTLKAPAAPRWAGLDDGEEVRQLHALRDWAGSVLAVQYPGYLRGLPPCWPGHREALWELGNLRAEWQRIYADPRGADLAAALWWHERWLPGVLTRLKNSIPCDEAECTLQSRPRRDTTTRQARDRPDAAARSRQLPRP